MATVVLPGTHETKGVPFVFLRERVCEVGGEQLLVESGELGQPQPALENGRHDVAKQYTPVQTGSATEFGERRQSRRVG